MKTIGLSTRPCAIRMRPLAAGLAAICAVSASAMAAASTVVPEQLTERFPQFVTAAPDISSQPQVLVTNCDDSGAGSLRDAVAAASSGDTIDMSQLTCSHITLTTGAIVIGQNQLAIQGPGENNLTIDGGLAGGVLYDLGGGTLIVNDLSIINGFKYRSDVNPRGGCVHAEGNAILTRVNMSNCQAISIGYYAALGGAVWTGGQTLLDHSIVRTSEAHATFDGYASGGGVYALGGLVSLYSTIANNVALNEGSRPSFGGGAFARGGALIIGTTVNNNQAGRMGGLALADNSGIPGTIANSTVSGNVADQIGGVFSRAELDLYNSTIAFNRSSTWVGGSGNNLAAGVYITVSGEMDSTILANNVNTGAPYATVDLSAPPAVGFNGGHNNVMFCAAACPVDTSHEDPGLQPLQDNGGITRTHVPTPGIWDTFGGTNVLGFMWDQRGPGFPRQSAGDFPEIGALQLNSDIIFANGFN